MKKHWPWIVPTMAWLVLGLALLLPLGWWTAVLCLPALIGAVLAAVHQAEVIAHRVGEPYGTLVLALAVTVIEVALMISMMLGGDPETAALPRDTLFATIMIIANGMVGICLVVGGLKHHEQEFRVEGTGSALAALIALSCLSLVLPQVTVTTPGPEYSPSQLAFAALASLTLWAVFVFGQTGRYRDYFLPANGSAEEHAASPTNRATWIAFALLMATLVVVVALAKTLSPLIEAGVDAIGAPRSALGIAIAVLVLLPEGLAAIRAAQANRLQTSLNLALGSGLASIGLTIPAVALLATLLGLPLHLGLETKEITLLAVTFLVCAITLGNGRTNLIQGAVHLVLFAAFLFLAVVP
jgi:Ca2+:H+ antiporter